MTEEQIFEILEEADAKHIDEYLDAVLNRKRELYPDWDIFCISLPNRDREERERLIRMACSSQFYAEDGTLGDLINSVVLWSLKEADDVASIFYADEVIQRVRETHPGWSMENLLLQFDPKVIEARKEFVKELMAHPMEKEM